MKILRGLFVCVLAVGGLAVGWGTAEAQDQETLSQQALDQIAALYQEKSSWTETERKMDSHLILESKRRLGKSLPAGFPRFERRARVDEADRALIDIDATVTQDLLNAIEQLGGEVIISVPQFDSVRAAVPFEQLGTLAGHLDIRSIREADQCKTNKINTSEGDGAHGADLARMTFGVDGTGVSVGVLSDTVEDLVRLQGTGDLPPVVTVLPGQSGGTGGFSEGTAMLEIVFDLAPGVELFYATAFNGQASFAQNILNLQAAGCQVIVDDVGYFAEPVFQDGVIAQAVNTVTAGGSSYFSAAGNSGNFNAGTGGVYEADFNGLPVPTPFGTLLAHVFGVNQVSDQIVNANFASVYTLQWNDPVAASGNDYDLLLFDAGLLNLLAASITRQNGFSNPFEQIGSIGAGDNGNRLVIIRFSGENRYLHMNTFGGILGIATPGNIAGHAAATGAFAVAAVDVADAPGGAGNPFDGTEEVETFSSDGPRRVFYDAGGNPLTPGNLTSTGGVVRDKPDFAAADGVSTATNVVFPFDPFFGTSAAAPHAAALAALLIDGGTFTKPDQVRTAFSQTALDIEELGFDRDSGFGIVNINAALGIYCNLSLNPPSTLISASGIINGVLNINIADACPWEATSNSSYIHITSANSGTGPGAIAYTVDPNNGLGRGGSIAVNEQLFNISQAGCVIPSAVASPQSQAGCIGGSVQFSAAGTGTLPVNIQWQVNEGQGFKNIPGANGPVLTVNNITQSMDGYQYHAVFFNACGDMATTPAVLTVGQPGTPNSLNASDGDFPDRVRIVWSAVPGATSYTVFRSKSRNGSGAVDISGPVMTTEFNDFTATTEPGTGCEPEEVGIVYTYFVVASNPCGVGGQSPSDAGSIADPVKLNASLRPETIGDIALLLLTLAGMYAYQRRRKVVALHQS